MDDRQRLLTVINHWIEHNDSHSGEYRRWAQKAEELGLEPARAEIEEAMGLLSRMNYHLRKAIETIHPATE